MKYLNLGCGYHYSIKEPWINLDFIKTGETVIAHNLLKGIPFADHTFAVVYHSHVLEHFAKSDGFIFLKECYRVLAHEGIIRIAIPDLEQIVRNYLKYLEIGLKEPANQMAKANYDWMMIEMYDQTVRNYGGGEMANYIFQKEIPNETFVFERIGEEGRELRNYYLNLKSETQVPQKAKRRSLSAIAKAVVKRSNPFKADQDARKATQIGNFRLQGEIHQWMYDRYSLRSILQEIGFKEIEVMTSETSRIPDWNSYQLDAKDGKTRKPDSLFIEATKK